MLLLTPAKLDAQEAVPCADPIPVAVLLEEQAKLDQRSAQISLSLDDPQAESTRAERNAQVREQRRLEARRDLVARQRAAAEVGKCLTGVLPDDVARAEDQRLLTRIEELHDEAAGVSLRAPLALTLSFAIATVGLGLTTFIKWTIDRANNDGADDASIAEDRRVNRALAISVAPLMAGTIGSAVWLGLRHAEKRRIIHLTVPLQQERRRIEPMIAPDLRPTSWGVSFRARF